jgi:hypothetical protein
LASLDKSCDGTGWFPTIDFVGELVAQHQEKTLGNREFGVNKIFKANQNNSSR